MSLRPIVRALGGDLYAGGLRANIPAPGHNRHDRSVSLLWSSGRLVIHSFGAADWREVRDYLDAQGFLGGAGAGGGSRSAPSLTASQRAALVQRLWADARSIQGTLGERHLRLRGVGRLLPDALRFHPRLPLAIYAGGRATRPACLAAITNSGESLTALEVTYLDAAGRRAVGLRLSRKTIGAVPAGSAVRLDPAGPRLLVAEGVATALSACEHFGLPTWALLGARNLAAWSPPDIVRSVLIAGDRGQAGEGAAAALARRLSRLGVAVEVSFPPAPFGDWNEAAEEKREGADGCA